MRTLLRIGPNTSRCLSCTPIAARLAHGEKCRVGFVIDSFMVMVLLSSGSVPSIGMTHHRSFRKSFSAGSTLPLLWTKFRYLSGFQNSLTEQFEPTSTIHGTMYGRGSFELLRQRILKASCWKDRMREHGEQARSRKRREGSHE